MMACKEGKYAVVEKLLEKGASVSDVDLVCRFQFYWIYDGSYCDYTAFFN